MDSFRIQPDVANPIKEMSHQQLLEFCQSIKNPTTDTDIELVIYTNYIAFRNDNSVDHLAEAIKHAESWFGGAPETHPDRERRRSIFDTLVAQKPALERDENRPLSKPVPTRPVDPDIQALEGLLSGNPDPAPEWNSLAVNFINKFAVSNSEIDITRAAKFFHKAILTAPLNHPGRATYFNNFATCLLRRFETLRIRDDLDTSVKAAEEAVKIMAFESLDIAMFLNTLGGCLGRRYEILGAMQDLDRAIDFKEQSIKSTAPDHSNRVSRLNNLSVSIFLRYEKTGQIQDLRRGIEVSNEALRLTPFIHPNHPASAIGLIKKYVTLHEKTEQPEDLDHFVIVLEELNQGAPLEYVARPQLLTILMKSLSLRHTKTHDNASLDRAIDIGEEIGRLPNLNFHHRAVYVKDLGYLYAVRYDKTGKLTDINHAVDLSEQQLKALPLSHPDRPDCLSDLAQRLGKRHEITESVEDVERAVALGNEAVQITPHHSRRASHLHIFGSALARYFETAGAIQDLDRAIEILDEAATSAQQNSREQATYLGAVGNSLIRRYERTRALLDLNRAVVALEQASKNVVQDDSLRPRLANSLGFAFGSRYGRTRAREDLDRAVDALYQAVNGTPSDTPDRHIVLNSLGAWLFQRYDNFNAPQDLDRSIRNLEKAVQLSPSGSLFRANSSRNLARSFETRYKIESDMKDLDRAISLYTNAVEILPSAHSSRALSLQDLATALNVRCVDLRKTENAENRQSLTQRVTEDAAKSLKALRDGWNAENTPPIQRAQLGMKLGTYLSGDGIWGEAYHVLEEVVRLLPRISPRTSRPEDRQFVLREISGLAPIAAAAALNNGKSASHALQLLETGRGVIAGLLLDMRTDTSALARYHLELAQQLTSLWNQLASFEAAEILANMDSTAPGWDPKEKSRLEADKQLIQLIGDIQRKPGFENFLQPPSEEEIMASATRGPIVVVNISFYRCDAFLIEHHQIRVLQLPKVKLQDVQVIVQRQASSSLVEPTILEWLWDTITAPILNALDFKGPPKDGNWPHVWWIPTGLLVRLPLHAAGYHNQGSTNTVLDRVMSSYGSSIRTIIHERRMKRLASEMPPATALLVAMPETPGLGLRFSLEFADQEVSMLSHLCPSLNMKVIQPTPCKKDILNNLQACHIFHFAGHGSSDPVDPSRSSLLLKDWQENPLMVADLRDQNFQRNPPFLGYLSACSTGVTKDEGLVDEGIHLISALQLAGFRHVIGTLWDVSDERCVHVANIFYQTLVDKGMNDETVCLGLHLAVRALRSRSWKAGGSDRAFTRRGETEKLTVPHADRIGNPSANQVLHAVLREKDISTSAAIELEEQIGEMRLADQIPTSNIIDDETRGEREGKLGSIPRSSTKSENPIYWAPFVHYGV